VLALAALLVGGGPVAGDEGDEAVVTEPPAYDGFVVIPLRVHVLSSSELPEADCRLSDADIARIVGKVNAIWHVAGVHWGVEAIVREPAARPAKFRLARDLDGPGNLSLFAMLAPEASRDFEGVHVYYIHAFAVNGVWLGDAAFVQETAALRPVEGGLDEPIPRVTAHELGHALGLRHRQDRTNLLASGTTGTQLNAREVAVVRRRAPLLKGASAVPALRASAREAAAQGDRARALRLWSWLAEVPGDGDGAAEARAERDRLREEAAKTPCGPP
jgi:hypothetical protein